MSVRPTTTTDGALPNAMDQGPRGAPGDARLVALVAAADREAFRLLYERYADRLFRYAVLRLGDAAAAEDAVQETFLAVWKDAAAYEGRSSVSTWLFGIAHHKVNAVVRGRARETPLAGEALAGDEPGPDREEPSDERLRVLAAIRSLTEEHREVLFLAYYQGLGVRETAAVCGIPEGTVKSRLHHARRMLAERLGEGEPT